MNRPENDAVTAINPLADRRLQAVYTATPPHLDGELDKPFWQDIPGQAFRSLRPLEEWVTWRWKYRTPPHQGGLSTVKAAWDANALYLAFDCRKLYGQRQPWNGGDGISVHLQSTPDSAPVCITIADTGTVQQQPSADGRIETAVRDEPHAFHIEAILPFAALGIAAPTPATCWRANVVRVEQPLNEPTAWAWPRTEADRTACGTLAFVRTPQPDRTLDGRIADARPEDRIVIESPAGIHFPDPEGTFRIEGLPPGPVTLRAGSFEHETVTLSVDEQASDRVTIQLPRLPETAIRQRETDAMDTVFSFEPRYEDDPVHRDYQGCPSLCVLPEGGLLATYTCYSAEDVHNAIIVDYSDDDGRTWRQEHVLKPGYYRASWGNLWVDPLQRVWNFHQLWRPGFQNTYYTRCDHFTPGTQAWLPPQPLCEAIPHPDAPIDARGGRGKMMQGPFPKFINKPVALSDGTWLAPVESNEFGTRSVYLVVSTDQGASWAIRGEASIAEAHREISEPMVVERRDGTLWMIIRTPHGMAESVSRDGGRTWAPFERSAIPHCSSRFYLGRLASGNVLLVKHGPMTRTVGREYLTALLSPDDGATWPHGLVLCPGACSYPDVDQDPAGKIHVIYDKGRHGSGVEIRHSVLREADILAGKPVSADTRLNQIVARTGAV